MTRTPICRRCGRLKPACVCNRETKKKPSAEALVRAAIRWKRDWGVEGHHYNMLEDTYETANKLWHAVDSYEKRLAARRKK